MTVLPLRRETEAAAGADSFKQGMRRFVSGLALVTTVDEGRFYGFIATSIRSVSIAPPSLLFCINQESSSYAHFMRSGVFGISVLRAEDEEVSRAFSSPALREKRFTIGEWITGATGTPLLKGSVATFDCRVAQRFDAFSHTIVVGVVEATELADPAEVPLIYAEGRYGSFVPRSDRDLTGS